MIKITLTAAIVIVTALIADAWAGTCVENCITSGHYTQCTTTCY